MPKVANEISPRYTRGRYRARPDVGSIIDPSADWEVNFVSGPLEEMMMHEMDSLLLLKRNSVPINVIATSKTEQNYLRRVYDVASRAPSARNQDCSLYHRERTTNLEIKRRKHVESLYSSKGQVAVYVKNKKGVYSPWRAGRAGVSGPLHDLTPVKYCSGAVSETEIFTACHQTRHLVDRVITWSRFCESFSNFADRSTAITSCRHGGIAECAGVCERLIRRCEKHSSPPAPASVLILKRRRRSPE
ncbi:hypothetical protein EVAR_45743_1 [Eumeta japonica]|uniref:Uncharacterized protein n=1 Tax=Eumeta variegata TaxID=151549 RepID=A0A4C1YN97_EUMVA|nr:hypothetical protein EVAR_45743_1 [Eumeta japonica]